MVGYLYIFETGTKFGYFNNTSHLFGSDIFIDEFSRRSIKFFVEKPKNEILS